MGKHTWFIQWFIPSEENIEANYKLIAWMKQK